MPEDIKLPVPDPTKAGAEGDAAAKAAADATAKAADAAATGAAAAKAEADRAAAAAEAERVAAMPPADGKYSLKVPDGSPLKPASLDRIAAIARERKLSQAQAEALVAVADAEVRSNNAELLLDNKPSEGAAWKAREKMWSDQSLADPVIGGSPEKLKMNVEHGKMVINKFGGEEMKLFLDDTGLGSHPAVIRFAAAIYDAMKEADFVIPDKGGIVVNKGGSKEERRMARLFPSNQPKAQE